MADQKIMLDLDAVEDRGYPPYTFQVGGQTLTFTDPSVLDWQVVEGMESIEDLAEHCMSDEDRKVFYETPLAAFKLGLLFEDVQRHFELGQPAGKRNRRR